MKRPILLFALSVLCSTVSHAQFTDVLNNSINFEFTVEYNQYFNGSSESGNSEPVITTNLAVNGSFYSNICHTWSCEPNCYDGGGDDIYWAGSNYGFNATWEAYYICWEEDGADDCTYGSGDDDHWEGWATLRDGATQQALIYPSSDFRPCQIINSLGNGGSGWLLPNSTHYNQILQLKWRYSAGDSPDNRLNFGTIGGNQSKSDINSNRSIGTVGGFAPVGYTHVSNSLYDSPDVWYSFTIDQAMPVTIRTNHGETDFDTYIRLWTEAGAFVAADDQSGGNNTSLLTTTLCPGSYTFMVEGWQSSTGIFKVSVETGSPVSGVNANATASGVSCSGEANGYAEWNPTGGVAPYTWTWQGVNIPGNSFSGLAEGNFSLVVTDACGSTASETLTIDVSDDIDPVAQCVSSITLSVASGQSATLSVNDVDNGSSDNCGIADMELSQTTFTVGHVGTNSEVLTVFDDAGNWDNCTVNVIVNNTTGIEETQLLQSMDLYPNPTTGVFNLDLSSADIHEDARISILDVSGREIYASVARRSNMQIDLGKTASGIYLLRLTDNGITASKRISIQ